mmetsp:Transcript_22456/g.31059  ORF Transcript_22456/g.31059 Transcript_22456/m.31059 type:complete len:224 (-) Transcript_22456:56-727(-)
MSATSESSISTPAPASPRACAAVRRAMVSVPGIPVVSARVRGTTARASANFRTAYWSRPAVRSPSSATDLASSASKAPPPATRAPSRHSVFTAFTASSTARARSLMTESVAARSTTVASRVSPAAVCSRTRILRPATSRTSTRSQWPISSGVAAPTRTSAVAFTAAHSRRSSHFEGTFTHMTSYLVRKCRAISETEPPTATTRHPLSAIARMASSIARSSPLL